MSDELAGRLVQRCADLGLSLVTAESCTGGMIAQRITSVAGSSSVFWGGFVTYSNQAKTSVLGVSEDLLNAYGAVSEQVVVEMARGALRLSDADLGVSVSGIAGPGGGTTEKPVGTVWISVASTRHKAGVTARRLALDGDREEIRRDTSTACLDLLLQVAG